MSLLYGMGEVAMIGRHSQGGKMSEEAITAAHYRKRAEELRARASRDPKARSRNESLRLADEYDWRAASLEAASAFRTESAGLRQMV
jgi:hypothetical protein